MSNSFKSLLSDQVIALEWGTLLSDQVIAREWGTALKDVLCLFF